THDLVLTKDALYRLSYSSKPIPFQPLPNSVQKITLLFRPEKPMTRQESLDNLSVLMVFVKGRVYTEPNRSANTKN
ncbi:MAG TPA: hypothetical protein PLV55_11345, partial [Anaerohalosphaeraceae bacterium]|nr:hypothetical protein [Anaerohalosphaeraceae bacterium]